MARIGYPQFREHREGFDINVEMWHDRVTSPDASQHTPEEISAHTHTDWQFVRVRVTAGRKGIVLGEASQPGFGYGWFPHPADGPVTQIHRNPIDQANIGYAEDAVNLLTLKAVEEARLKLWLTCDVAG